MFIVTKVGEVLGKGQEFEAFALGYVAQKNRYIHDLQISRIQLLGNQWVYVFQWNARQAVVETLVTQPLLEGLQGDGSPFWHI